MKTDGKFIIQQGQGITQGIQQELGLSNEECKQLQQNSIWSKILNEFESSENVTTTNNINKTPCKNNNYFVNAGAVIEFTQESWKRIVGWVNNALEINTNKSCTLPTLADISVDEIAEATKYNDIKNANQKGLKIGNKWYDFDSYGRCERIYNEEPCNNPDEIPNSFTSIIYEPEGNNVFRMLRYLNNGKANLDGTKTYAHYDKTGKVTNYSVEHRDASGTKIVKNETYNLQGLESLGYFIDNKISILDVYKPNGKVHSTCFYDENGQPKHLDRYDENGEIEFSSLFLNLKDGSNFGYNPNDPLDCTLKDMFFQFETMTEEDLNKFLAEIDSMQIDKGNYSPDIDNLFFAMRKYGINNNRFILEDMAKANPELADMFIKKILDKSLAQNDTVYKYITDIQKDMAEHPNDYKKLNVDLQRLLARPFILKESTENDVLELNNQFDEPTFQGRVGNCYLLSAIKAIDTKTIGREMLEKVRTNLPNGDVLITCEGNGKQYLITAEDILNADHLSKGDDDMRPWEIAMDRYRRDCAYESPYYLWNVDSNGGTLNDVAKAFWNIQPVSQVNTSEFDLLSLNSENTVFTFGLLKNQNVVNKPNSSEMENEENEDSSIKHIYSHAYRITRFDNNRVYFTNPWDDTVESSLSADEFKNLEGLILEKLELR